MAQGLTRSQLIELVNRRTERKADRKLDLTAEFYAFLQDFCSERPWHWRRRTVTFNTVAGTSTYDLSDDSIASSDASDVETIICVKRVQADGSTSDIDPIHCEEAQTEWLESTSTGEPSGHFIEPGTTSTLRIVPTPNGAYKMRVTFWATPSSYDDGEDIPLVPPAMHNVLVAGFEAHILKNLPGMEKRAVLKQQDYDRLLDKTLDKMDFADGRVREFKSTEEAIRST